MDFDNIISLFILLLFFIFPTIIKQIKAAKKNPEKKTIFNKIGNQIDLLLKEIEQQGRQQKATTPSSDIWEALAENEAVYFPEQSPEQAFSEFEPAETFRPAKPADKFNAPEKIKPIKVMDTIDTSLAQKFVGKTSRYRSNPLQNAVIWSEILGKPVALK
ncbi:MAG: hypothetical protein ABIJ31_13480 [Pseudomonadota bacterium]